jgi:signal transduction histidine kinase/ligand-binding sensor domain-containing protein
MCMVFVVLVCTIVLRANGTAQTHVIRARRLSVRDGLSSNYTTCIFQDSRGFMWIGTREGLNKYDGYSFRKYLHHPFDATGLPNDVITAIAEDLSGNVWIATYGGGLARLNRWTDVITSYRHDATEHTSPASDRVLSLHVDVRGTLWVGYDNGAIDRFDAMAQTFQHVGIVTLTNLPRRGEVRAILEEPTTGKLLICTDITTLVFDPAALCFTSGLVAIAKGHADQVLKICEDPSTQQWLAFGGNSFGARAEYWCVRGNPFTDPPHNEAKFSCANGALLRGSVVSYGHDRYLLPLREEGLWEIDIPHGTTSKVDLTDGITIPVAVDGAVRDRNGSVWLLTRDGLFIADERRNAFQSDIVEYPRGSGSHQAVRSLLFDHNRTLWVGGGNGFIFRREARASRLEKVGRLADSAGSFAINALVEPEPGLLWASATAGPWFTYLASSGKGGIMQRRFVGRGARRSYCAFVDSEGTLWSGLAEGADTISRFVLARIDQRRKGMQRFVYGDGAQSLESRAVWTILDRDRTSLWVGTPHGMYVFDKRSQAFGKHFVHQEDDAHTLSNNNTWVLYRAHNGLLWVGTWGGGLNCMDESNETFRHVTIDSGLPSNYIRSILEDGEGNLWVATSKGISCFNPTRNTFRNYSSAEGLLDDEFEPNACAISPDGEFYFGGTRGITHFFPGDIHEAKPSATLVFTAFHIADKERPGEVKDGDTIVLRPRENYFSIDYSILDFRGYAANTYEYTLKNCDQGWIDADARTTAAYNGVDPGTYEFCVRMAGRSGIGVSPMIHAFIVITPPWWATGWFRYGISFAALGFVGAVFVVRRRRMRAMNVLYDEAREKERLDIAGDLHDGPLQDLYAARFFLPQSDDTGAGLHSDASRLDTLFKRALVGMQTITGQLQMPRFEGGLAQELRDCCEAFTERHPSVAMHIEGVQHEIVPLPMTVMQNTFRVFRTALSNIEKHAQATAVNVALTTGTRTLHLEIRDNGIGFTVPDDHHTIARARKFGLLLMRSYAEAIGADVHVVSAPGEGTRITLQVRW